MRDLPALVAEDLAISIGVHAVVDGVSFGVRPGEVLALVGESGCGKSMTALALLGLLPDAARVTRGRVWLQGQDLLTNTDRQWQELRGRRVSIIFQEPTASLDPLCTIGAQVAEAYRQHHRVSRAQAWQRARDMLDAVGIADPDRRLQQYPFELSGGMCQRVMIAQALICAPEFLIADEPTTALDVTIQAQILDLMRDLVARRGTGIVLITHDMGVVADVAQRVAVMYAGRIVEIASVDALFADPLHPYTRLLMGSVPRPEMSPKSRLATIEGSVPQFGEAFDACRFAPRCPLATQQCRDAAPALAAAAPGHDTACWHAGDGAR